MRSEVYLREKNRKKPGACLAPVTDPEGPPSLEPSRTFIFNHTIMPTRGMCPGCENFTRLRGSGLCQECENKEYLQDSYAYVPESVMSSLGLRLRG